MKRTARFSAIALMGIMSAGPLMAQGMIPMSAMKGFWNPVVGTGAVYEVTRAGGDKKQMEWAIVGKESVDGKDAYWMEMTMDTGRGTMVTKSLIVHDGDESHAVRTIMQAPGQAPMEMPSQMIQSRPTSHLGDVRKQGKDLGKETITVPAGTFVTEHWQSADGQSNTWISTDVAPMAMVKSTTKDGTTIVLVSVDKDVKDKITGTPQPFNPMGMMGMRPPQQPPQQ
jgi:hypothetical protein